MLCTRTSDWLPPRITKNGRCELVPAQIVDCAVTVLKTCILVLGPGSLKLWFRTLKLRTGAAKLRFEKPRSGEAAVPLKAGALRCWRQKWQTLKLEKESSSSGFRGQASLPLKAGTLRLQQKCSGHLAQSKSCAGEL